MKRARRSKTCVSPSARRCLACGCAPRSLQKPVEHRPSWCPKCGADLYARPPRSYAEMEGLSVVDPRPPLRPGSAGFMERGLALSIAMFFTLGVLFEVWR